VVNITEVLGTGKYIRANPITLKYMVNYFVSLIPLLFDLSLFMHLLCMYLSSLLMWLATCKWVHYLCLVSKHTMVLKFNSLKLYAYFLPYSLLCRKAASVFLKILVYLFALGFHVNIITLYTQSLIVTDSILKSMKFFKKWAYNCILPLVLLCWKWSDHWSRDSSIK